MDFIRESILTELSPCTYIVFSAVLRELVSPFLSTCGLLKLHSEDLMHDVSLRSAKNRMDAHNLAIVLSPNLVASGNPLTDVEICGVAGAPLSLSPARPLRDWSFTPGQ